MTIKIDRCGLKNAAMQNQLVTWCLGVMLIFPWAFVFALPPLQIGNWIDVEGVALGIASLGAISAVILLCISWNDSYSSWLKKLTQKKWKNLGNVKFLTHNPLLFGTVGLTLLSIVTLPFSYNYSLSWLGHPEQMIGGWFWLSISTIILCYLWLKNHDHNQKHKQAIRVSTEFACLAQIMLVLFAHPQYANATGDWVLYHFTSHLGWVGASLLILSIGHERRYSNILKLLAIVAIIISLNKIAMTALVLGPILYMMISKYIGTRKKWAGLLIVLMSSPFVLLMVEHLAFSWNIFPSLSSRFISLKVLWMDFIQAPLQNLFTGMGWGQMSDSILRQVPYLQKASSQEVNWEGIGRFDASSLNQSADALAAVGFLGFIFCFLIPLSPFLMTKTYFATPKNTMRQDMDKAFLFTACLMVMLLHHGWFMMLSVFPLFISAVMTLDTSKAVKQNVKSPQEIPLVSFAQYLTLGAAAIALLWTSHSIYSTGVYYNNSAATSFPVKLAHRFKADFNLTCENLIHYRGAGSISLAHWLRSYLKNKNDPNWDKEFANKEVKCALKAIRDKSPQPSLTLINQIQDYKSKKPLKS